MTCYDFIILETQNETSYFWLIHNDRKYTALYSIWPVRWLIHGAGDVCEKKRALAWQAATRPQVRVEIQPDQDIQVLSFAHWSTANISPSKCKTHMICSQRRMIFTHKLRKSSGKVRNKVKEHILNKETLLFWRVASVCVGSAQWKSDTYPAGPTHIL